jgi:serine protein kinase
MWAVLTRLEDPKHAGLTRLQKLKLYNGKIAPRIHPRQHRATPRRGQDRRDARHLAPLCSGQDLQCPRRQSRPPAINPFMVLNELENGLEASLPDPQRGDREDQYRRLISVVKEEYTDIVKNEVQRAIAADEEALTRLCGNYIDNVKAYTQRKRSATSSPASRKSRRTPDAVDRGAIDIPDTRKDDFRREIMNYIGALSLDGKKFNYKTNERLQKALELKLFEDQKDTIKLTSLVSNVVDQDTQMKIDIVKGRLIRDYGYNDESATDVSSNTSPASSPAAIPDTP